MADLVERGEGEGDRVTDFAAANEAEALIGKTRNPETEAESEGEGELGKKASAVASFVCPPFVCRLRAVIIMGAVGRPSKLPLRLRHRREWEAAVGSGGGSEEILPW